MIVIDVDIRSIRRPLWFSNRLGLRGTELSEPTTQCGSVPRDLTLPLSAPGPFLPILEWKLVRGCLALYWYPNLLPSSLTSSPCCRIRRLTCQPAPKVIRTISAIESDKYWASGRWTKRTSPRISMPSPLQPLTSIYYLWKMKIISRSNGAS